MRAKYVPLRHPEGRQEMISGESAAKLAAAGVLVFNERDREYNLRPGLSDAEFEQALRGPSRWQALAGVVRGFCRGFAEGWREEGRR